MTLYQIYTRIKHMLTAKHWRGAAIHSPAMYAFVREHALHYRGSKMIRHIGAPVVDSVKQIDQSDAPVVILREPFRNRAQKREFDRWYAQNNVIVAHFQGLIVIFFDKKRQKERYLIRN